MVPLQLTLLGPPELRTPDGDIVRFRTRKHFALLIYLAVEPSVAQRRDRLATLLWSRADTGVARHSLATGLSLLRGRFGANLFETTRESVRLTPSVIVTDLANLEQDAPATPVASMLGPFLDGFEIDDSPEFQHWIDTQRAHLMPSLHAALTRRIEYCRRHGDSRQMEAFAERLARIDELSETAARALLEARAMAGDRIGGLRLYDRWRAQLAEDLGAVPSPAIIHLADRLRRNGWEGPRTAVTAPVPTEQWKERTFVGRGTEFATCYQLWETARTGTPRHVLIRGDSGIGKTTLIERVATAAALEGAAVARVKCYALERELPFGVIGSIVTHLLELPGASATPPEHLAEVGRLFGKVRQRYPTLPPPIANAGDSARILLTEGVMAMVAAVAEERPIVLAVDDFHLADEASLAVLHLMLRRIDRLPLMVMMTTSSDLGAGTLNARRFVETAAPIGMMQLALGPLSPAETTELLTTLTRQDHPGATLRRAVLAGARGNPMILELLLNDWRRRGDDCLALSLGAMTTEAGMPPEETFRQLVERSLADLDQESRAVAELGAILGQRLNDLSMYVLVDLPAARTMRAMTSLTSQHILRDAGPTLEFANEFVRGQCYAGMNGPLRRMLHGCVADRLLAEDGADAPIPGLEVAWHLVRADRLLEAVPFLLAGAREAIQRGAPHEADLALSTGLPALAGEPRRTAILLLAEAQQELGRWGDSLQLLDLASEAFSESEEGARDVYRITARRWLGHLSVEEIVASTDQLLDIANASISMESRVKALTASVTLLGLTRNDAQLALLESAVARIDRANMDPYQDVHAILTHAWVLAMRHDTARALTLIRGGVEQAEAAGIGSSIMVRLLIGEGNLLSMSGRYDDAMRPLQKAMTLATRLDNATAQGACACQQAVVHGRLGRVKEQIESARAALGLFSPHDWSAAVIGAAYELGLGLAYAGREAEAQAAVSSLSQWAPRLVADWARQGSFLCEADVLVLTGNSRRAFALASKAMSGIFTDLRNYSYAGQYARWRAQVAIRDNSVAEARADLARLFPFPDKLDRKDEAEVLAAFSMLDRTLGKDVASSWREVEQKLAELPPSITLLLKRMGNQTAAHFGPPGSALGGPR